MSEDYIREKLWQSVEALATGAGTLQERLLNASLALISLRSDDFPDERTRAEFSAIHDLLSWREADGDEGTLAASGSSVR